MTAVVDLTIFPQQGVVMDTTVVETTIEVQELSLAELAQVSGGFTVPVFE